MTKIDVIEKVTTVEDIFSLIVKLYILLDPIGISKIHSEYYTAVNNHMSAEFDKIQTIAEEIGLISVSEFNDWIEIWKEELNDTKLTPELFCYVFLLKIDDVFIENSTNKDLIFEKGPFCNDGKYRLYLKPPKSFFHNVLKKGKIIKGRQSVEYDTNTPNADFYSFEVIKDVHLHDFEPKIREYNYSFDNLDEIKIACIPLSDKNWFNVQRNRISKELSIEYDTSLLSYHNETIKQLLFECENRQVNFAIFPELAMTINTKNEIKKFLSSSNFKHLKLCYLGSVWQDNINEAYLMTGKGTVLMSEKKKAPFRQFEKEENCYYTEAIQPNHQINFVDIPQIGRIVYLICADFNDDSINAVCSVMHTNFVFVSAFSNDTDLMEKTARSIASRKGISVVICNSCAALNMQKSNNSVAYCVTPKVDDRRLSPNVIYDCTSCISNHNCEICIKTFTMNKT